MWCTVLPRGCQTKFSHLVNRLQLPKLDIVQCMSGVWPVGDLCCSMKTISKERFWKNLAYVL